MKISFFLKAPILSLFIFISAFYSYTLSMRPFNTIDSYPNNFVAVNWLINRRLDLTNLENEISIRGIENIIVKNKQGVAYPKTPLIVGILNIPGFTLLNWYYNIRYLTPHQIVFSDYPQYAGKILAAFYCALSAALLFLLLLKITKSTTVSFTTAIVYSFGTNIFNTASQANWQHGASLLLIILMLLSIIKDKKSLLQIFFIGSILGLLTQIRISNFFYLPFIILSFVKYTNKKWSKTKTLLVACIGFLTIFAPISLLNRIYDVPYGYRDAIILAIKNLEPIRFSLNIISILISPNYGLFIYSPVLILGLFAIRKALGKDKNDSIYLLMRNLLPTLVLFLVFDAIWPYWTGGTSLGARMLTETLPIWSLLVAIILWKNKQIYIRALFAFLLAVSITINLLTTFMIDGWWFRFYTKQTPESQLQDAWYYKPSLLEYLLKTRIFYFESFKKEGSQLTVNFNMRRHSFKTGRIEMLFEKKSTILEIDK